MIRAAVVWLAATAVAAVLAVLLVGRLDPAVETVCRFVQHQETGSSTHQPELTTDRIDPSIPAQSHRPSTAAPRTVGQGTEPAVPASTDRLAASTTDVTGVEECLPADQLPDGDRP